jgi:hypothetical protein
MESALRRDLLPNPFDRAFAGITGPVDGRG